MMRRGASTSDGRSSYRITGFERRQLTHCVVRMWKAAWLSSAHIASRIMLGGVFSSRARQWAQNENPGWEPQVRGELTAVIRRFCGWARTAGVS
jgi:hypothetical protein